MIELEELKALIDKYKDAYYNEGQSPISDQEYDALVDKASKLGYIDYVGSTPVKSIPTIKHDHMMLSLDKVHSVEEIKKFAKKDICMMLKMDGLSISCTYNDGVLVRLETRGDGEIGNDVLFHANSFENLPKLINKSGKYVIDGECVILCSDFETMKGEYSNPRNLASGSLNQLDPSISAERHLRFIAWDVIEGGCSNVFHRNLDEASELGFDVVPYIIGEDIKDSMLEISLDTMKQEAYGLGYPIDGVVLRYEDIKYGKSLGTTARFPLYAIAYKYATELYETRLDHIEWQNGKTNIVTPVAVFNPVNISGTEVNKASLHNLSIMETLGITKHCTCYVTKANEIIPQIISCDDDGDGPIDIPQICPVCGAQTKIIKTDKTKVLYCTNNNCSGRLLGLLSHFVGRSGLNIKGLSEQTLDTLIKRGIVHNFYDVLNIKTFKAELMKLPGMGERSVTKLLQSIDDACEKVDSVHFISAFSIPGIGLAQSKLILKKFNSITDFIDSVKTYDFTSIAGIGEVLNDNIHNWFCDQDNLSVFVDCYNSVNLCNDNASNRNNQPNNDAIQGDSKISGQTFVITGKLNNGNRSDLTAKIESLGGKVSGSVSKNTDYLINNDATSNSSKNLKAKDLGIKIITEEEFYNMI